MNRKITLFFVFAVIFSSNAQCYETIMAAAGHSAAIRADGSVWGWGANSSGQNGNGLGGITNSPGQTGIGSTWKALTSGSNYGVALSIKTDGTLWGWTHDGYPSMSQIGTDSDWQKIAVGSAQYIGLKDNGTIWLWGSNSFGSLGTGNTINNYTPTQLGTDTWISIAAGTFHSVAVKSDGTLWAWGYNENGEIGDGTYVTKLSPVQIGTDNDWSKVESGGYFTMGQKNDGTLWSWGANAEGQLGHGNAPVPNNIPVKIGTASDWISFSVGYEVAGAVKSNGTLWTWGSNSNGQLGNGTSVQRERSPVQASPDTDWMLVDMGNYHGLALKSGNTLWAWGWNNLGQIGDGTFISRNTPVMINCVQLKTDTFSQAIFSIYPNPVKDFLYIENPSDAPIDQISIADIYGKTIYSNSGNISKVDLSALQTGLYLLQIHSGKNSFSQKIIKE